MELRKWGWGVVGVRKIFWEEMTPEMNFKVKFLYSHLFLTLQKRGFQSISVGFMPTQKNFREKNDRSFQVWNYLVWFIVKCSKAVPPTATAGKMIISVSQVENYLIKVKSKVRLCDGTCGRNKGQKAGSSKANFKAYGSTGLLLNSQPVRCLAATDCVL